MDHITVNLAYKTHWLLNLVILVSSVQNNIVASSTWLVSEGQAALRAAERVNQAQLLFWWAYCAGVQFNFWI